MRETDWIQKRKEREKLGKQFSKSTKSTDRIRKWFSPKLLLWVVLGILVVPVIGAVGYFYQQYAAESAISVSGNTITVRQGGDFQAALDRAKSGDTIILQAGATFRGSFNLPNKEGSQFITVRTSALDLQLPPNDTRIDPKKYASVLPKLSSPTVEPVINAVNGAHHFRFIGIEFGPTKEGVGNVIKLGTTTEKKIEELPHHIEFDRVYIHGSPTEGQRRGIAANGKSIKITNSYISDCKREGEEAQGIAAWATDGPIEIVNNYIEGSAENILFGGAGSTLKLVPTDVIVRGNWLNKPLEWKDSKWAIKNLFEIKFGKRFQIENNLMTSNWGNAQDGTAVLFTTRADIDDATIIDEINFSNNIVRGSGAAISVYGPEGSGGRRLTIRNNLFDDIDKKWNGSGNFMKASAWAGLVIENNTILQTGNITSFYDKPISGFVFRNNIVNQNEYGFFGDSSSVGQTSIDKYCPNSDVSYNAVVGGTAKLFRGKNLYPSSIRQIGFSNIEGKDFRLSLNSPLRKIGVGGKQIGADLDPKTVGGK